MHRQERRVVADIVLDDDHDLHAHERGVVRHVQPVLDLLDDRQQDGDVALPQVDALEVRRLVARKERREFARVVREEDHRYSEPGVLDLPRQRRRVHVADVHRRDDEVEAMLAGGERQRLGPGRHAGNARTVPKTEVEEFAEDPLAELAVFRQDERVVQAADEQDVLDAMLGQVLEAPEAAEQGRGGLAGRDGHHEQAGQGRGTDGGEGRSANAAGLMWGFYTKPWFVTAAATVIRVRQARRRRRASPPP